MAESKTSPHLLHQKPPKAQIKKHKHSPPNPSSTPPPASVPPPAMASSGGSWFQRNKPLFRRMTPFVLAVNFAFGAYVLTRTIKKQPAENDEASEEISARTSEAGSSEKAQTAQPTPLVAAPVATKVLPPITKDEQRHLLKWVLEEKRKVKTKDPLEKKKIDEEKALLKHYIRTKSLPSI